MKRLDRIFTDHPVYGSRRLQVALLREGISVGRRRIRRKKLGVWAVRPKRNTNCVANDSAIAKLVSSVLEAALFLVGD